MKQRTSTLTRKGQVTIPAEIRRALALKQGDKVAFELEGDQVRIAPQGSIAEQTAGMFKTGEPPLSAEELRAEASELSTSIAFPLLLQYPCRA
jgi:AbrB family looped-hinge helix DNA binding protein